MYARLSRLFHLKNPAQQPPQAPGGTYHHDTHENASPPFKTDRCRLFHPMRIWKKCASQDTDNRSFPAGSPNKKTLQTGPATNVRSPI